MELIRRESDAVAFTAPAQTSGRVLIIACDPDTVVLLGDFVVRTGLHPSNPRDDEPVDQAVMRVRPRVVIVDYEHPSAQSPRLARAIADVRARGVLCAALQRHAEARDTALRTGSLYFPLPIAFRDFELVLRTALLL